MTEGLGRKELFSLLFLPFTIILQKKKIQRMDWLFLRKSKRPEMLTRK